MLITCIPWPSTEQKNSQLALKDGIYLIKSVFANFNEICQEMKKFYLFEVAIISVTEAAILVSLSDVIIS